MASVISLAPRPAPSHCCRRRRYRVSSPARVRILGTDSDTRHGRSAILPIRWRSKRRHDGSATSLCRHHRISGGTYIRTSSSSLPVVEAEMRAGLTWPVFALYHHKVARVLCPQRRIHAHRSLARLPSDPPVQQIEVHVRMCLLPQVVVDCCRCVHGCGDDVVHVMPPIVAFVVCCALCRAAPLGATDGHTYRVFVRRTYSWL